MAAPERLTMELGASRPVTLPWASTSWAEKSWGSNSTADTGTPFTRLRIIS